MELYAKVQQMTSPKSGSPVANQFLIRTSEGTFFQSYSTIIAFRNKDGHITLDENSWDYSTTTGKYRNKFLGEGIADTRKKIKDGVYSLKNLN